MTAPTPGETTFTTPSDLEIEITRVVAAPRGLVFDAYTKPEHLQNWMLGPEGWTMVVCEIDLRPGGLYRYEWNHSDGTRMAITGGYLEVTPPDRLVCTESWGGDWPETRNTLTLHESDGLTTITQRVRYPSREARDAALRSGMKDGVKLSFRRLERHLETVARV
jgi:uncharacterized protein YndB with AHSA1/START domain